MFMLGSVLILFLRNDLLLNILCETYDISTHQLWVWVMNWCHMKWLRFQQDNLTVDGEKVVCVHDRGSLFDVNGLVYFPLVSV